MRAVLSRRAGLLLAATTLGVLGTAGVASAATYTVNTTTDTSDGSCTPTLCSLRDAVEAADNTGGASTITVPAGTYTLSIAPASSSDNNNPATGDLNVINNSTVTINGAGAGQTIVDANHIDRAFAVESGSALTLAGTTVSNGTAVTQDETNSYPCDQALCGGAVYSDGTLTLFGDAFTNDSAAYGGAVGADYTNDPRGSALKVVGSQFSGNSSTSEGGAIYDDGYSPIAVSGSSFSGNSSQDGGAISDEESTASSITDDRFTNNNSTSDDGGALYLDSCYTTYNLARDEFDSNSSARYGGAITWYCSSMNLDHSTLLNNSAVSDGGAIYEDSGGTLSATDDTISGNSAPNGGAFYLDYTMPSDLINDTITNNSATAAGGGIDQTSYLQAYTVGVQNTIIAGNQNGDCADSGSSSSLPNGSDAGYNLDSDGTCLTGTGAAGDKPHTTPLLGAPANNGASVLTEAELAGSPTIDAGTDANCPASDARGVARPQGASCDMGAYEVINGTGQLSLGKTAPTSTPEGSPFAYTITVGDRGPGQSDQTNVVDQLPANTTLVALNPSQGSCTHTGTPAKVSCALGTIASGSGATVTVLVTASQTGSITNTASVSNYQGSSASGSATTMITAASAGSKPVAITGGRKSVTSSSARLLGTVRPGGQGTGYFFEVGKTKRYGLLTAIGHTGTSTKAVSELIRSLSLHTRYHYRLVAINGSGTSYGRDRTFTTAGYLGRLVLRNHTLAVRGDTVFATFTCASSKACLFRFSITIHARVAGSSKVATVSFTKARTTLKRIGAHRTVTVAAGVNSAALAVLRQASGHRLAGKLTTRPRTNQKGLITGVTLQG